MRALRYRLPAAFATCFLAVALVFAMASPSTADDVVPITRLIEQMKKFDGQQVTIEGEAVGDIMVRGDDAWITVNDDPYSKKSIEEGGELVGMSNAGIGVWLIASEARQTGILGGYKNKGAIVRVEGIFHRACVTHGGDTDIHADALEVVKPGYPFNHGFHWDRLAVFLALCVVIALLWYWRLVKRRKWAKEE